MKPENPADLAARFLALWQEQWAETMADPEAAAVMSALFNQLPGGLHAFRPPGGATSGLAASMAGERERAELARRVDALEARLAELEAALGQRSGKPAKPARRPATKPAGRSPRQRRQSPAG